ncbi:hypothetical protein BJ741DRAFT_605212 [Chytriomyces cf. hyalinus JEL632]|nr:hypothetical protein BJ741DRAFT_605212 [Chytriomyces cf. hyalinus JEL632]
MSPELLLRRRNTVRRTSDPPHVPASTERRFSQQHSPPNLHPISEPLQRPPQRSQSLKTPLFQAPSSATTPKRIIPKRQDSLSGPNQSDTPDIQTAPQLVRSPSSGATLGPVGVSRNVFGLPEGPQESSLSIKTRFSHMITAATHKNPRSAPIFFDAIQPLFPSPIAQTNDVLSKPPTTFPDVEFIPLPVFPNRCNGPNNLARSKTLYSDQISVSNTTATRASSHSPTKPATVSRSRSMSRTRSPAVLIV